MEKAERFISAIGEVLLLLYGIASILGFALLIGCTGLIAVAVILYYAN